MADPARALIGRCRGSGYSGASISITPGTHVEIGMGFSLLAGVPRGRALMLGIDSVLEGNEKGVTYDLEYVDGFRELARLMQLDARASFKTIGGAGASASLNLFRASKFSSRKAYVLVRTRVVTGTQSISAAIFAGDALQKIRTGVTDEFYSSYGDSFISHIVRGAELYALMEFSAETGEKVETLRSSVKGSVGGFKAAASYLQAIKELTKNRAVKVLYAQSGGKAGRMASPDNAVATTGGVVALTPEELIGRIREFGSEAMENPEASVTLRAEATDYNVIANRPRQAIFGSGLEAVWSLNDLGETKILVDEKLATAEQVLAERNKYLAEDQSRASYLANYARFLETQLERISGVAMAYPASIRTLGSDPVLPNQWTFLANACNRMTGTDVRSCLEALPSEAEFPRNTMCPAAATSLQVTESCLFGLAPFAPEQVSLSTPWIKSFREQLRVLLIYRAQFDLPKRGRTHYWIGCGNPDTYVRSQCAGQEYTMDTISSDSGGDCGYSYFVAVCKGPPVTAP